MSLGVWTVIGLAETVSRNQYLKSLGLHVTLYDFWVPLVNACIFALLTPPVFRLAVRYPVERKYAVSRVLGYLLGGLAFTVVHVLIRGLVFPVRDPRIGTVPGISGLLFERLFFAAGPQDVFQIYLPIVVFGRMVAYYQRFKDREAQLALAQLEALKSKLQPHFLFNTMHSISAMMFSNVTAADKMMSRLAHLLRLSLENDGTQETTLSKELEFLDVYIQIEKARFEDQLEITIAPDPATLTAYVPALLLQPLVENAIRHGIAKCSGKGRVRINSFHDSSHLHLRITDNGPGFEEGIEPLAGEDGIGLKATRERLQTLYGEAQSFSIQNAPDGGVEVCVDIPFSTEARRLGYRSRVASR